MQCKENQRFNVTDKNRSEKTGRGHKPGDQMLHRTKTEGENTKGSQNLRDNINTHNQIIKQTINRVK